MDMDSEIRRAIAEKHLVEFHYQGYLRIAEPHVYGLNGGVTQLLVYQVKGGSKSGGLPDWRRVDLPEVTEFRVLLETFPGPRPYPSGKHSSWDQTFAVVS